MNYRRLGVTACMLALVAVAGCGDGDPEEAAGSSATPPAAETSASQEQVTAPDLPSCEEIHVLLGEAGQLLFDSPNAENGTYDDEGASGVSCTWVTEEGLSDDPFEVIEAGGVNVGIHVSSDSLTLAEAEATGLVVEDARIESLGGFVLYPGDDYQADAPIGAVAPQVVFGDVTISFASVGVYLQEIPELASLTNEWSIQVASDLYESMS